MTAKNYEAWDVSESEYPSRGRVEDQFEFLLRYAILAPSGPNTQPWMFSVDETGIKVHADLARALPFVDPSNRTLYMSVGCAIANLIEAARHFGFSEEIEFIPDGGRSDLIASIELSSPGRKETDDLFHQIKRRHTTKDRFDGPAIEPAILAELERPDMQGIYLKFLDMDHARAEMVDLVSRAHRIQLAKKEFRRNLGEWLRNNWTAEPDGMPLYTFGVPDAVSLGFPAAFQEFDLSRAVIYRDSGLINGCAALAIMSSEMDDLMDWTRAGVALERLLLRATAHEIRASFFSQPIGLPDLRAELYNHVDRGHPQILFALGMGKAMRPSPRRPLRDVIVTSSPA